MSIPFVLVVGAGPSGLLLALLLGKQGIPVQLLEAAESLDDRPRATHYSPPAVYELQRAGVLDDMKAEGAFIPNGACWRKLSGEFLAGVRAPENSEPNATPMICLSLNKLSQVLQRQISQLPHVEIVYSHKVTSLGQDADKAWVTVETPSGVKTLYAQYIVGCDGANSQIRRSLFGDWEFPGFTWDEQIVATNVCIAPGIHWAKDGDWRLKLNSAIRPTTRSRNTGSTGTLISSSTLSTGIWLPASPTTDCGALPTASWVA
jgi:2-polyprenyl-6-methoxyphenol hydroxylase-like FAD-dependent oxidoreductase